MAKVYHLVFFFCASRSVKIVSFVLNGFELAHSFSVFYSEKWQFNSYKIERFSKITEILLIKIKKITETSTLSHIVPPANFYPL